MNDRQLYERVHRLLIEETSLFAACSRRGRLLRRPGVIASVLTNTPERSLFNWVVYERLDALLECYDDIARSYEEAGVRAWTVWVPPGDAAAARAMNARGHRLDSRPLAMAADLHRLRLPPPKDLDWYETRDAGLVARINDVAYGFPPPAFAAVMDAWQEGPWHAYVARLDGQPVGALLACDGDNGDCGISAVATLPAARGRGVATRLLTAVLRRAQGRGLRTTSLQANHNGARIYAALGYRNLGAMEMWGRREP